MTDPKPDRRGDLLRVCKTCGKTQGEHGASPPHTIYDESGALKCAAFVPGDRYDFKKRRGVK